jgi:hypothetical protein
LTFGITRGPLILNTNENAGHCKETTSEKAIGFNKIRTYQDPASKALHNWD